MDALTCHRLRLLGFDEDELVELDASTPRERVRAVYRRFLDRIPYENLSNLARRRCRPAEPDRWPRGTDRLLRDAAEHGLGGTCFSMAYALADLFRGCGALAHTTLGHHLQKAEPHAAVLVYEDDGPHLFDASYFVPEGVPVWPGGCVEDSLFRFEFEARRGPMLALVQAAGDGERTALFSIIPMPAPPDQFRRAWIQTFLPRPASSTRSGRFERPARIARRVGDEIRWFGEEAQRVDTIRRDGKSEAPVGPDPVTVLHELFGVSEDALRAHFASGGSEEAGRRTA